MSVFLSMEALSSPCSLQNQRPSRDKNDELTDHRHHQIVMGKQRQQQNEHTVIFVHPAGCFFNRDDGPAPLGGESAASCRSSTRRHRFWWIKEAASFSYCLLLILAMVYLAVMVLAGLLRPVIPDPLLALLLAGLCFALVVICNRKKIMDAAVPKKMKKPF